MATKGNSTSALITQANTNKNLVTCPTNVAGQIHYLTLANITGSIAFVNVYVRDPVLNPDPTATTGFLDPIIFKLPVHPNSTIMVTKPIALSPGCVICVQSDRANNIRVFTSYQEYPAIPGLSIVGVGAIVDDGSNTALTSPTSAGATFDPNYVLPPYSAVPSSGIVTLFTTPANSQAIVRLNLSNLETSIDPTVAKDCNCTIKKYDSSTNTTYDFATNFPVHAQTLVMVDSPICLQSGDQLIVKNTPNSADLAAYASIMLRPLV